MYSIHDYAAMIADQGRTDAYAAALRKRITPDSVVLDLGAGAGILTLLACRFGARKVYAIEFADVIQVARECVEAAGFGDRVDFIQQDSSLVKLPEKVHGIVSDVRGILPLSGKSIISVLDARDRFLLPNGWMIPSRDTLWVSVVSAPRTFEKLVGIWSENPYGLDMGPARQRAANNWSKNRFEREMLHSMPKCWVVLDYQTLSGSNVEGEVELTVGASSEAHGLTIWFDCEAADEVGFSNDPTLKDSRIYGQAFFPWPEPVCVDAGDVVSIALRAILVGSEYLWQWNTSIRAANGKTKAAFRQNSFAGSPISSEHLRRCAHGHVPQLKEEGRIARAMLERMEAGVRLEEIAREFAARYPQRYCRWEDALTEVGELSAKYSV